MYGNFFSTKTNSSKTNFLLSTICFSTVFAKNQNAQISILVQNCFQINITTKSL